jgi:hypothetical protein
VALASARRASAAAGGRGDGADIGSEAVVGMALYWAGESAEAHRLLARAVSRLEDRHLAALDAEEALFTADWRAWTGVEAERGRSLAERILDEARAAGALGLLPYTLHVCFHLLVRDGDWTRAYAGAGEGARIAAEVGNVLQHHQLLGYMALIEAAQGREGDCRSPGGQRRCWARVAG